MSAAIPFSGQDCRSHNLPLNSPLHSAVCDDKRRNEEKDLVSRAADNVPEALVDEGGHGALSVGAQSIGNDALARSTAALVGVTPGTDVPSVYQCQPRCVLHMCDGYGRA